MPSGRIRRPDGHPDRTKFHGFWCPPRTWATLTAIAAREGLTHGGQPSPAQAIAWLADRDAARRSVKPPPSA